MNVENKAVLVVGMGETGLSMARWLQRLGAEVRAVDTRAVPPCLEELRRLLPGGRIATGADGPGAIAGVAAGIDLVALSPGVPHTEPVVRDAARRGVPLAGDMELFAWAIARVAPERPRIIAITGSNGKTTVTAMTGAMARKAGWDVEVAGNIGPAVLDALTRRLDAGEQPQAWVLELSSFQLEATRSLAADAATVLNLSEDHLDRYAGMEDYAAAKARLFRASVADGGVQVLNRDDFRVRTMAVAGRRQVSFGLDRPAGDDFGLLRDGDVWLAQGDVRLMRIGELGVAGLHNAANALAALALCRAVGLPLDPLLQALREFRALPHRMQQVAEVGGVTFYDDSKGTNVGATVAALRGMMQPAVLIAGGDGKGQDFSPLAPPVTRHARAVVLIGRDAGRIHAALEGCGVPLHRADTLEEAVRKSFALARKGDAVLMSPACASLDMFRHYAHRAEVFVAAVRRIQEGLPDAAQASP
ncbi:UDP-N-acetylmuramoyl-L-alanine--D-glutamate ligase [Nitrosovibrio sp. Nv17]|jgi:UDP-N-acetylmuramoylalanine--D-glutamate ligase|uniref:UDP-N-acetylmuramoyl-L-alanine--D-glutamate ligase n=1 Tax=Nitrosovibrio sp. Nv17 TaxID=1855339 RepID=UPI00090873F6|nr:UDP-N-acetylmuramoyl-L-alanine--D-glutamate ligase [Nitrosovibrio sp. Nv17]SFW20124.1 UDP-N-acetylmuramoylalanine--D-glutamate ligase [Nitrosovibrio sp. Nv17]